MPAGPASPSTPRKRSSLGLLSRKSWQNLCARLSPVTTDADHPRQIVLLSPHLERYERRVSETIALSELSEEQALRSQSMTPSPPSESVFQQSMADALPSSPWPSELGAPFEIRQSSPSCFPTVLSDDDDEISTSAFSFDRPDRQASYHYYKPPQTPSLTSEHFSCDDEMNMWDDGESLSHLDPDKEFWDECDVDSMLDEINSVPDNIDAADSVDSPLRRSKSLSLPQTKVYEHSGRTVTLFGRTKSTPTRQSFRHSVSTIEE